MSEYIACPKYGGMRTAAACCTQDIYRYCRKRCKSLADYIRQNPKFPEEALAKCEKRKQERSGMHWLYSMKYANKNLPSTDKRFVCSYCGFTARSTRGLKTHMTRQHGGK